MHGNEAGTDSEAQFVTWAGHLGRQMDVRGVSGGVELGKVETASYDVSFFMYVGNVT